MPKPSRTRLRDEREGAGRADGAPASHRAATWLTRGLVAASVTGLAAVVLVVVVHLEDRYAVDHASGARIALARYASNGLLYPPVVGDGSYAGTRFMPAPVLLHAWASKVTGEYLVSGKLLALAAMVGVVLLTYAVVRRSGCPRVLALGIVTAIVTTDVGLVATAGLRGDSLPLLLQLGAVVTILRSRSHVATWSSALLATLAVTAKLHALWAVAAICLWLWLRDRRRLGHFTVAYLALTAAALGSLSLITDGRLVSNVFGYSTAGLNEVSALVASPYRLLHLLTAEASAVWLLLPIALLVAVRSFSRRHADLWHLALVLALAVLLVVLADIGTGSNQLLDIAVLSGIVLGNAAGSGGTAVETGLFRNLLSGVLIWAILTGGALTLVPAVREAVATVRDPTLYRPDPLAGVADTTTTVLSEDPYVPVSLDQDPVVLDPFMLLRIQQRDPAAVAELVERVERQEFDLVVLQQPLDDRRWWAEYHFGSDLIAAVERSYSPAGRIQGYDLYRPSDG